MNRLEAAARQALEWFRCYLDKSMSRNNAEELAHEVVSSLREALGGQQAAEPVAYIHRQGNHWEVSERHLTDDEKARGWMEEPLYTHPAPTQQAAPDAYNRKLRQQLEQAAPTQQPLTEWESYKQAHGSQNCMQCAVAYMLGASLASVPDFARAGPNSLDLFYSFILDHGFTAEMLPPNIEIDGDYLASGPTERGTHHMVVMRGGTLLHDPHPSNAGLKSIEVVWLIVPRAAHGITGSKEGGAA